MKTRHVCNEKGTNGKRRGHSPSSLQIFFLGSLRCEKPGSCSGCRFSGELHIRGYSSRVDWLFKEFILEQKI